MPPERPDMRKALGREAIYGEGAPRKAAPTGRKRGAAPKPDASKPTWEETNQRVTFHCPTEVLAAVEAAMAATGRSKSRVIVDAIRENLGLTE